MIVGRLANGRPFVRGRVSIDTEVDGSKFTHEATLDFLVDTGADVTALGTADLTGRLHLPLETTTEGEEYVSFGERFRARTITGFVLFPHDDGDSSLFRVNFVVPPVAAGGLDVSILGCDIILVGRLVLSAEQVLLDLPRIRTGPA